MILETGRLRLEPLAPEHAEALRAIWLGFTSEGRLLLGCEPADLHRLGRPRLAEAADREPRPAQRGR